MISYHLGNAKVQIFVQSESDLYRLAVLKKYGGIYMDVSYVLIDDLSWLVDIQNYDSRFIFNRYGDLPTIFMLWHPDLGSPFTWSVN